MKIHGMECLKLLQIYFSKLLCSLHQKIFYKAVHDKPRVHVNYMNITV